MKNQKTNPKIVREMIKDSAFFYRESKPCKHCGKDVNGFECAVLTEEARQKRGYKNIYDACISCMNELKGLEREELKVVIKNLTPKLIDLFTDSEIEEAISKYRKGREAIEVFMKESSELVKTQEEKNEFLMWDILEYKESHLIKKAIKLHYNRAMGRVKSN